MKKGTSSSHLLTLSALGVVYGDIGTSPLYALKEAFRSHLLVNPENIFGVLSLIFWSLILIVSIKYLIFVIMANNHGEGGVLALTALLSTITSQSRIPFGLLTMIGLFGAALLYGDGIITPAISVLSAVEGLEFVAPELHPYIIPVTVAILLLLFSLQKHGAITLGRVFGVITLLWFLSIGYLGILKVIEMPQILEAVNPLYAVHFFKVNSWAGFTVLGSIFLVVTGGEALYSDLGHFGKTPIRRAWFFPVLPALLLNYFGQGALLLQDPSAVKNPFYFMSPQWALIPLIVLATFATVIASQALITGVFSLTMQAVQLHYLPRITINHMSQEEFGQIYVRSVNTVLMISCIALVLFFQTSSNLSGAYGIAVATTMVITTVLFYLVARHSWKWPFWVIFPLCSFFLIIEGAFLGANFLKFFAGGWFPLLAGLTIFTIMATWRRGRQIVGLRMKEMITPMHEFLEKIKNSPFPRVPGTAIYMSGHPSYTPVSLAKSFKHFNCIHEKLIFLHVQTVKIPYVKEKNQARVKVIGPHIYEIVVSYGFMDVPNIPAVLKDLQLEANLKFDIEQATFFMGRERIMARSSHKSMMQWQERVFAYMSRNAQPATDFYQLPYDKVIEIGAVISLTEHR